MRRLWRFILFAGVAFALWRRHDSLRHASAPPDENPKVEREESTTPTPAATAHREGTSAPIPAPIQALGASHQGAERGRTANERTNPGQLDRFSLRKLGLPNPSSVSELFSKLTDYKDATLPTVEPGQSEDRDGDLLTAFRGYHELSDGRLGKILLDRSTSDFSLALQESDGKIQRWSLSRGELTLKTFNGDPYALVALTPDRRAIYLKFRGHPGVESSPGSDRNMVGWILSDRRPSAQTAPLAMFDSKEWPSADVIRLLFPQRLPAQ